MCTNSVGRMSETIVGRRRYNNNNNNNTKSVLMPTADRQPSTMLTIKCLLIKLGLGYLKCYYEYAILNKYVLS